MTIKSRKKSIFRRRYDTIRYITKLHSHWEPRQTRFSDLLQ